VRDSRGKHCPKHILKKRKQTLHRSDSSQHVCEPAETSRTHATGKTQETSSCSRTDEGLGEAETELLGNDILLALGDG